MDAVLARLAQTRATDAAQVASFTRVEAISGGLASRHRMVHVQADSRAAVLRAVTDCAKGEAGPRGLSRAARLALACDLALSRAAVEVIGTRFPSNATKGQEQALLFCASLVPARVRAAVVVLAAVVTRRAALVEVPTFSIQARVRAAIAVCLARHAIGDAAGSIAAQARVAPMRTTVHGPVAGHVGRPATGCADAQGRTVRIRQADSRAAIEITNAGRAGRVAIWLGVRIPAGIEPSVMMGDLGILCAVVSRVHRGRGIDGPCVSAVRCEVDRFPTSCDEAEYHGGDDH